MARPRGAFSLGEILVAVAIIAVVSAVLLPTIASQISKADPQEVGSSAGAIRSAVEQFASDVRRYPGTISQLIVQPTAGATGLVGGTFATSELLRWAGPYLQKDAASALKTGYSLSFDPSFAALMLSDSLVTPTAGFPKYVILCLAADSLKALAIDRAVDDGDLKRGSFRWTVGVAGANDTLKFLVIPIQ